MSHFNQALLVGNLGSDPEVKETKNGLSVRCRLATNSRKRLENGDYVDDTQWHNINAFGHTAKYIADYCKKGSKVLVCGELRTNKYTKDGQDHFVTAVYAKECRLLSSKKAATEDASPQAPTTAAASPTLDNAATPPPPEEGFGDEASYYPA